ncbi:bifunctional 5,10-methylene-tetrahydrofolate dehydrogenase/ 5,10-methylene-tetrahydrofolate cyclohydrolase [Campylobacter sputorum subsp. bubulus]|uniref:Bifunctional protein FolD n=1 Tax=Campylobacter sputorum subsp. sputorum TaxID=32024 RepID=A0A381DL70_9BACT|nr:bifunctional methylenetetrahydrofolate dehydrogenase/methenyltetrahydrofolate cyclohydrolase FolD [Campylobacter sputorum]ASM34773.1 bifunctional 5,10-methylene-tetrahydrofolate dehydrogenase / 5,10-methylene-tetrahydrofolate cyclohydrolase [Campylobacter sputorum aubsp. sputorum RM3237]KAB0581670.1 bifunctional methylenetetrahydrofolate dehydrogenase/methenyltetrahydrofolate cyclohydrolase FolD [Campylobacter sputorum subsp. sputorum]QEL04966.1 bifunctional 5,10-methylene-tetrahydrofolate de
MTILDGKALSAKVKSEVKQEAIRLKNSGIQPALAVILVGEDKASQTYVNSKEKACNACEIRSIMHRLPENTSENELLALIDVLNLDDSIDGILVQLPLPKHISEQKVIKSISPFKDVDGFHAINTGNLVSGIDGFVPCTPLGIMRMFSEYGIDLTGKLACVIGRSNIVGKPMINLLLNANATVIATHSKTKDLSLLTKQADILVVAIGKPHFLTSDMVKDGAVVIDVGINRLDNGTLVGDVDFENVKEKCSFITPVPGGVGPMTIAMLLNNTIKSAQNRLNKAK